MRKEDIKVGDLLRTHVGDLLRTHERLVLVMSLEPHPAACNASVLVTVLDLGVRTIVPVDWLEPL
jgi:hypothetical protein